MVDYNVPFSGGRITIPSQAAADYLSQQGEIKPQDKTLREKSTDRTADKLANGALRIDMGPVVLTEQQASEKALRTGTTNLRVEDGAYVADDPEYGPSILGQVAVEAPVLSPEDQRRIAIENQIKDVGYGLAQGVMVGAQNINRLVPGLPQLLDRVDSGMRSIGFPDTRMRAPESLTGALASGFGQAIPGIIPGVAALRAAGYGKFAADVLGGLIGDAAAAVAQGSNNKLRPEDPHRSD